MPEFLQYALMAAAALVLLIMASLAFKYFSHGRENEQLTVKANRSILQSL